MIWHVKVTKMRSILLAGASIIALVSTTPAYAETTNNITIPPIVINNNVTGAAPAPAVAPAPAPAPEVKERVIERTRVIEKPVVKYVPADPEIVTVPVPVATPRPPFDGFYRGVSRISSERQCLFRPGIPEPLTVENGLVKSQSWTGSIDSDGRLTLYNRAHYGVSVAGWIDGAKVISASYSDARCNVSFVWRRD
jgi:hypothetical protein